MTDHSAFDSTAGSVLQRLEIMANVATTALDELATDCTKRTWAKEQIDDLRMQIDNGVRAMCNHHLLACDDRNPWCTKLDRRANCTDEYVEVRFGKPYRSTRAQIARDYDRERDRLLRENVDWSVKCRRLEQEVNRLGKELDKAKGAAK